MTMLLLNVQRCETRPSNSRDYVSTPCMYILYLISILPILTFHPFVILLYFLQQPTTSSPSVSDEPTPAPVPQETVDPTAEPTNPNMETERPTKVPSKSPTSEVSTYREQSQAVISRIYKHSLFLSLFCSHHSHHYSPRRVQASRL